MAEFSDIELAMIAIILDEEEETEHKLKNRKWVHEAWKKRESAFIMHNILSDIHETLKNISGSDIKFHRTGTELTRDS